MDIQKFIEKLPSLSENWGEDTLIPQLKQFEAILTQIKDKTTFNILQLLNGAVECLEDEEIYCEIGCNQGLNLIGSLLNNQDKIAYSVDSLDDDQFNQLIENVAKFNLDEQVFFCNQNVEEFFTDLKELQPEIKIGVYFNNGNSDYRSTLMGLLLVRPFLADQALIIINNSNYTMVSQTNYDFINSYKACNLLIDLPSPPAPSPKLGRGDEGVRVITILTWDVNQEINYSWQEIENKYRNSLAIEAISDLHLKLEFQQKPQVIKSLIEEGFSLYHQGKYDQAIDKNKEALLWDKYNPNLYNYISLIYLKQEQYQQALESAENAVIFDSLNTVYLFNLGTILEKLEQKEQAIETYQKILIIEEKNLEVYIRLSKLFVATNQLEQAKLIYEKIIELDETNIGAYVSLGDILIQQENYELGIENYQKALIFKPKNTAILEKIAQAYEKNNNQNQALLYYGYVDYRQDKYEEAIKKFKQFFVDHNERGTVFYYVALADCYRKLGKEKQSRETYIEALKYYPQNNYLYLNFILLFQSDKCTKEDEALIEQFIQESPDNIAIQIESKRILPIIYESEEEINYYRNKFQEFINYLDHLMTSNKLLESKNLDSVFISVNGFTNFYLQYQYKNDKQLQQKYGTFINYVMGLKYPNYNQSLTMPPLTSEGKIKIGYMSMAMNFHTVSKLIKGWFKHRNKEQFEIYCYYGELIFDQVTNEIEKYCDKFYYFPKNLEKLAQQIYEDQLHILVFIEIGMSPIMSELSALRLAPIQCTTWCHPVTSGSPNIDYFLSSKLMETENSQEYYTETLINLPNLGVCYEKPKLPQVRKNRSDFNINNDKIIYLCCQSVFKYLPQYDYLFAEIAKQVPQAQFVFLTSKSIGKFVTETFINRLNKAFNNVGLNRDDYCLFLSQLKPDDYFNLNLISDVFLDSLGWSGGNTTLEALACNLPIVTCPGEFMRSRHSYGILKMLEVEETIANNEQEYINIAVKLGLNYDWRNNIKTKIETNLKKIYNDLECIKALEQFYQKVINEKLNHLWR